MSDDATSDTLAQVVVLDASSPSTSAADGGVSTVIGQVCKTDSECGAPANKCNTKVTIPFVGISIDYAGGYCTKQCKADAECGPGAGCPNASSAALMPALSTCLKSCTAPSDCRTGYSCAAVPAFAGFGATSAPPTAANAPKFCLPPLPI
jgi:hypothetical protein